MNNEFPELQKLLELRGQAGPADEYFEEFLDEFHRRQRQDLMKRSARSLFWERLAVWYREMGSGRWVYAAGAAYAVVMVAFFAWPKETGPSERLAPASLQLPGAPEEEGVKILQFEPAGANGEQEKHRAASREF